MQTLQHMTSRFIDNRLLVTEYSLAVEALLEIYVNDIPYVFTMRLPGDDVNLAAGFCYTEGLIRSRDDLISIKPCENGTKSRMFLHLRNERLKEGGSSEAPAALFSTSSSGFYGTTRAAARLNPKISPVKGFDRIHVSEILAFKDRFESEQTLFRLTGATHSASIFDAHGTLIAFAEDIGRHNAFDKVIGRLVFRDSIHEAFLAIVSSRLSFEMVQKAAVLGLQVFCGLSAPTSMAVSMAEQLNMTLIGFLRENSMSIYSHPERILHA